MRKGHIPEQKLHYPIARIGFEDLHLQPNFYGVKLFDANDQNFGNDPEILKLNKYTDIVYVKAIMMTFRANLHNEEEKSKAQLWEMALYDYAKENFGAAKKLRIFVLGDTIVNHEVMENGKKTTAPAFVAGLILMFIFVTSGLLLESYYTGILSWYKVLMVAIISLCCPLFAVSTTFGLWSLLGLRTNSAMLIMPLLILGIGVDDAFLTMHAWFSTATKGLTPKRKIVFVIEEVGPSMTITTVTNVLTFAIGALTPTIEIQLFCASAAIALSFTFLFTLTILVPILLLLSNSSNISNTGIDNEENADSTVWRNKLRQLMRTILNVYCKMITNCGIRILLCLFYLLYIVASSYGILKMRTKLDTDEILPHNSPIREPNAIISNLIWTEYYPVNLFINNPLDITNKTQLYRFNGMLDQFERMAKCKGNKFTLSWTRDFEGFCELNRQRPFIGSIQTDNSLICFDKWTQLLHPSETNVDYINLGAFLSSTVYSHYIPYLKLAENIKPCNPIPVSKFFVIVTFHNTTNWEDRIDLMQQWRRLVDEYADLNATVWEANAMFVDQMLSLKHLAIETIIYSLVFMAIMCLLFIRNPISVVIAVWAIASISIGVIGLLNLIWGLDLNPITLCTILMCIGMSVDFTSHTSYHFQLNWRQKLLNNCTIMKKPLTSSYEKLEHCFKSIAWPMLLAGISTTIAVLPLAQLQNYIPLAFLKTITLVVTCGMLHGLVFLPAFLYSLPTGLLKGGCCIHKKEYNLADKMEEEHVMNDNK